jgi:hypothetical protein
MWAFNKTHKTTNPPTVCRLPTSALLAQASDASGAGTSIGWSASYGAGPGEEECNALQTAKSVAARKNFALLHAAVAQLGGVPQVSEDDHPKLVTVLTGQHNGSELD